MDIFHPWRSGISADGRSFYGTLSYILLLVFSTNAAYQACIEGIFITNVIDYILLLFVSPGPIVTSASFGKAYHQ